MRRCRGQRTMMRSARDLRFCGARRPRLDGAFSISRKRPAQTVLKDVSTDNHFFAVRSVGKNGARSIAVISEAERRAPPTPTPTAPKQ